MCGEMNGHKNYPTWAVNLWLGNDEATYNYWQGRAAAVSVERLAGELERHHEVEVEELLGEGASVFHDVFGWALEQVDWDAVARFVKGE